MTKYSKTIKNAKNAKNAQNVNIFDKLLPSDFNKLIYISFMNLINQNNNNIDM